MEENQQRKLPNRLIFRRRIYGENLKMDLFYVRESTEIMQNMDTVFRSKIEVCYLLHKKCQFYAFRVGTEWNILPVTLTITNCSRLIFSYLLYHLHICAREEPKGCVT